MIAKSGGFNSLELAAFEYNLTYIDTLRLAPGQLISHKGLGAKYYEIINYYSVLYFGKQLVD